MSQHDAAASHAASPSLALAVQIIIGIVLGIAVWLVLATFVFHIHASFASFLFLWYWAVVEKMDFARLPATLLGALIGAALAWQLVFLLAHFGGPGAGVATLIILLAIFAQIMGWAPVAFNGATTLFLTVITAPLIMGGVNFVDLGKSIVLGAVYFGGGVYLVQRILTARAQSKTRLDPAL